MTREQILDAMRANLQKVMDKPPAGITLASRLREDVGLDSFAAIELTFELEEACGVDFPQEVIGDLKTVEDVVVHIEQGQALRARKEAV